MVLSYMMAQMLPQTRKRNNNNTSSTGGGGGFLLVLGAGNVDECLRGYLTKVRGGEWEVNGK